MAVQDIVLAGFGSSGSVSLIVTRGYEAGQPAPPAVVQSFTGGWYFEQRPKRRKKQEEVRQEDIPPVVEAIVEDIAKRSVRQRIVQNRRETLRDLEIALRIQLRTRELLFDQVYLDALQEWRDELQRRADRMIAEEIEIAVIVARLL